ncbi:MAG: hypothetical protein KDA60_22080 [Planctomycetales bacterium]|nr:hypothetical protein [Planctomycetales bacterium]
MSLPFPSPDARRLGELERVLAGTAQACPAWGAAGSPQALYPGSFWPLHAGHQRIAELATELLGRRPAFEISLANVDKDAVDGQLLLARLQQFQPSDTVWVTRAATFLDKARIFGAVTFVCGADTIERVGDLRYYGEDERRRDRALAELADRNCRFLVFGRLVRKRFLTLEQLDLPATLQSISMGVGEHVFRMDVESRQLRTSPEERGRN